jgi:uncharacterized protein (AIM24 family)
MARFEVLEREGQFHVRCVLDDETVRTESGALHYMRGDLRMEARTPGIGGVLKAFASGETVFRPTYTGTGELHLEPSFGGFHVMELDGETWILESGAYFASESGLAVDVHREQTMTALRSGEGLVDFQTKVSGRGKLVIATPGPVEETRLDGERMVVDGRYVLAREASIAYGAGRATKSLVGSVTSGEGLVRTYEGRGRLLLAPIPYWRKRLIDAVSASGASGSGGGLASWL